MDNEQKELAALAARVERLERTVEIQGQMLKKARELAMLQQETIKRLASLIGTDSEESRGRAASAN